jgi:cysteine desulfurase
MILPVYLDYMSTTPVLARVLKKMNECLEKEGYFGNPSSVSHRYGWEASEQVEAARAQVAMLVGANPAEIIWTSGATEADNLALKGAAYFYQRKGKHIITMSCEHKAVLDSCRYLESQGFEVTYLNPQSDGLLDMQQLVGALRSDTILVSVMHVNNETGVIQDIAAIGEFLKDRGILFHVDAAQSAGKIPLDIKKMSVDLMSFSGHKIYGPKGVGALYVRQKPKVRLVPLIHGGNQEKGLRSGTLPTHQIVGMGEAFLAAQENLAKDHQKILTLRERLWRGISQLGGIHVNGSMEQRIAACLNIRVDGVDGESLVLSLRDLAISTGSACNSASSESSHVLLSMGLTRQQAQQSIRLSLGRFTTEQEIDFVAKHFSEEVNRLRNMSPLWGVRDKFLSK